MTEAAERVRAAIASGQTASRRDWERAFRETFGLSARQARRIAAEGVRSVSIAGDDDVRELADRLAALERSLRL